MKKEKHAKQAISTVNSQNIKQVIAIQVTSVKEPKLQKDIF